MKQKIDREAELFAEIGAWVLVVAMLAVVFLSNCGHR